MELSLMNAVIDAWDEIRRRHIREGKIDIQIDDEVISNFLEGYRPTDAYLRVIIGKKHYFEIENGRLIHEERDKLKTMAHVQVTSSNNTEIEGLGYASSIISKSTISAETARTLFEGLLNKAYKESVENQLQNLKEYSSTGIRPFGSEWHGSNMIRTEDLSPEKITLPTISQEDIARLENICSRAYKKFDRDIDFEIMVDTEQDKILFSDLDGNQGLKTTFDYTVNLVARKKDDLGNEVEFRARQFTTDSFELDFDLIEGNAYKIGNSINEFIDAPIQDEGHYVIWMDNESAGVNMHEMIGHRSEFQRNVTNNYKITGLKAYLGKRLFPKGFTLIDDPTISEIRLGDKIHKLNGYMPFDDEGTIAEKVTIIEDGIVRNFLTSRMNGEGVEYKGSNGHAKTESNNARPVPRMSNTILIVDEEKTLHYDPKTDNGPFKDKFYKEILKQDQDYGIRLAESSGGHTYLQHSSALILAKYGYRVYARDCEDDLGKHRKGDEVLVKLRGLAVTAFGAARKIVAASDNYGAFLGHCGAESGWILASEVAPDLILTNCPIMTYKSDKNEG